MKPLAVDSSRRFASIWVGLLAVVILSSACTRETPPSSTEAADLGSATDGSAAGAAIDLAVGVAPLGWLVQQVAGPSARVHVLVPPGAGPETFLPTDRVVGRVASSDLYFRLGLPFEQGPWMTSLEGLGRLRIIDLSSPGDAASDPHRWLDIASLDAMATRIAEEVAAERPADAAAIEARRGDLSQRLAALDKEISERFRDLRGESFLVFHPAWGRFADAYGLRQLAVETDGHHPTDADLAALSRRVRDEGLTTLFVAPEHDGPDAASVAERLALERVSLDPLGPDPIATLRAASEAIQAALRETSEPIG